MIEIENANQLIKFLNKSGYNSRVLESNDQLYKMLFKSEKVPYTNLSADFNKKIDELSNFNIHFLYYAYTYLFYTSKI